MKNNYIISSKSNLAIVKKFTEVFNTNVKTVSFEKLTLLANITKNNQLANYLNDLYNSNNNISKNSFDKMQLHIKLNIIGMLNIDLDNLEFKSYDERVFLLFLFYKSTAKYNKSKNYASRVKLIDVLNLFPMMKMKSFDFTIMELNSKINKLSINQINYLIDLLEK